ncbi:MAG: type I restriction enzyme HsdR N-terminal domain-containing protein [Bacteroidales bacterium]|nr:type I restriction enzyme HsdR N-terminal domain-containing protein [Bacteroidales bacterium]
MQQLNLPQADLRIATEGSLTKVYDPYRRKFVKLTPEEYVRQTFLAYLTNCLHYPAGRTAVEHLVVINNLKQRADIVVYDKQMRPYLIVECKAPSVPVTQSVFEQALRYNTRLNVKYLIVTNGLQHFCADVSDPQNVVFQKNIPPYDGGIL